MVEHLPFKQWVKGSIPFAHNITVDGAIGSVLGLGLRGCEFESHSTDIMVLYIYLEWLVIKLVYILFVDCYLI